MAFGDEEEAFDPNGPADDGNPFGMSEAELTHEVDVSDYVGAKRNAIASHRSQVTDTGFFLSMPEEMFANGFRREWFIERGREPGMRPGWLFDDVLRSPATQAGWPLLGWRLVARIGHMVDSDPDRSTWSARARGWDRDRDPDLDDLGRAQAAAAADRLESLAAPEPLAVITSPLRRCRRTAAALCDRWAVDPRVGRIDRRDPLTGRRRDGRAGRVAARRGARNMVRARRAIHHVSRRRRRLHQGARSTTRSCSRISSPSTP